MSVFWPWSVDFLTKRQIAHDVAKFADGPDGPAMKLRPNTTSAYAPGDEIAIVDLESKPRRRERADQSTVVLTLATASAMATGLLSSASPTGVVGLDGLYRSAFAFAIVWFAGRARRWTWAVLAGTTTIVANGLLLQAIAMVALGMVVWSMRERPGPGTRYRRRLVGTAIAAICVPVLMMQTQGPLWRLTNGSVTDPFGSSALWTVIAVVPIVATGWKTLSRKRRRAIIANLRRTAAALAVVIAITGAVSALSLASLTNGLDETRAAAELASAGDLDGASVAFASANESWDRANDNLSGVWMVPSRLVPILSQHVQAAQVVSGQASAITDSAATMTSQLDPDALVVSGSINVTEIDSLLPTVDAFAATVERASERITSVDSSWLIPPVGSSIDRANEILTPAAGVIGASAEALHVTNDLVGGSTPSQILVMFATPAEARGTGGFIGSWAVVDGVNGQLSVAEQFRTRELNQLLADQEATLRTDSDYVDRYGPFDIARHIQDVTISPDFPSVAAVAADLFQQATGTSVEAVIMVDPFVIQKLLTFSGPLETGTSPTTALTSRNVLDMLFVDQYSRFDGDELARETELAALTTTLLSALFTSPPDPLSFAMELAPLADQDRISLWLRNDDEGDVAERLGLDGSFPRSDGDLLALVHQNAGQNKIDSFLTRRMDISTTLDTLRNRVDHEVTITLENNAPSAGLPDAIIGSNDQGIPLGTNAMLATLYSELAVVSASIDGEPVPFRSDTEFGVQTSDFIVTVPSEDTIEMTIVLSGLLELSNGYETVLAAQPLVNADVVSWSIQAVDGERLTSDNDEWSLSGGEFLWRANLEKDRFFTFELDK